MLSCGVSRLVVRVLDAKGFGGLGLWEETVPCLFDLARLLQSPQCPPGKLRKCMGRCTCFFGTWTLTIDTKSVAEQPELILARCSSAKAVSREHVHPHKPTILMIIMKTCITTLNPTCAILAQAFGLKSSHPDLGEPKFVWIPWRWLCGCA